MMDDFSLSSARFIRPNNHFGARDGPSLVEALKRGRRVDSRMASRLLQQVSPSRDPSPGEDGTSPLPRAPRRIMLAPVVTGPFVMPPGREPSRSHRATPPVSPVRSKRMPHWMPRPAVQEVGGPMPSLLPPLPARFSPTSPRLGEARRPPLASPVGGPAPAGSRAANSAVRPLAPRPAGGDVAMQPVRESAGFRRMSEVVHYVAGTSLGAAMISASCLLLGGPAVVPYALPALALSVMAFGVVLSSYWLAHLCLADEPASIALPVGAAVPDLPRAACALFGREMAQDRVEWAPLRRATDATFDQLKGRQASKGLGALRISLGELRAALETETRLASGDGLRRAEQALRVLKLIASCEAYAYARANAQGPAEEPRQVEGQVHERLAYMQAIDVSYSFYLDARGQRVNCGKMGPLWNGIINALAACYDEEKQALSCLNGVRELMRGAMLGYDPEVVPFVSPPAHLIEAFGSAFSAALEGRVPTDADWLLVGQHMMEQGRALYAEHPELLGELRKRHVLPLLRMEAAGLCTDASGQWLRELEMEPARPLANLGVAPA